MLLHLWKAWGVVGRGVITVNDDAHAPQLHHECWKEAPSRDLGTPVEKKERRKEKEREGGKGGRKEKEKERKKDENARQSIMKLMHLLYFIF